MATAQQGRHQRRRDGADREVRTNGAKQSSEERSERKRSSTSKTMIALAVSQLVRRPRKLVDRPSWLQRTPRGTPVEFEPSTSSWKPPPSYRACQWSWSESFLTAFRCSGE